MPDNDSEKTMMVYVFEAQDGSDEERYRAWFAQHPAGFTVQSARKINENYLVLHKASCAAVTAPYEAGSWDQFTGHRYIKICSENLQDLVIWLRMEGVRKFSKLCARCNPPRPTWSAIPGPSSAEITRTRRKFFREIEVRQGAPAFRRALIQAYRGRCAATGCSVQDTLEAAHIVPYAREGANATTNGLLLRADIHTLFDLGLLAVDEGRRWILARPICGTMYNRLSGRQIAEASLTTDRADALALEWHRRRVFKS